MVIHIVGARPQFIKLAPIVKAFRDIDISFKVIHTGQHYDYNMSDLHFKTLGLVEPEYNLDIGSSSHAKQTARMLEDIEDVLNKEKPCLVMVYGDTNSTLSGALCAAKLNIPIAHVEAGVRSFDMHMPEEINRLLTDRVSTFHFCPTDNAVGLLKKEGINGIFTGDVMYDALLDISIPDTSNTYPHPFILTTIHRAENTDNIDRFTEIWNGLKLLSKDIRIIFPAHPRTRNMYKDILSRNDHTITITDPVSYLEMISMIKDASCMITDSGGVQKEAFLLKTPCITVRDTTEWPETIDAGANCLVPTDANRIYLKTKDMTNAMINLEKNPFGDGKASHHIAKFIKDRF